MARHNAIGRGGHEGRGGHHGSLKEYVIGFGLSIVLTIIPILAVIDHWFGKTATIVVLLITAVLQFAVQLLFFMHLREEEGPRYNLITLILGLIIVVVVVYGSIWIMDHNAMY
ncbi:cytochrome o ubiquinol oxidase operon protein cyoD [Paenibacillus sp. UNC496MF]|uniref:cytochrome o ubiquinol oxidase subunit IV n=1 Tax=Paenibacillus sp. UNC496MF TaxID=1502753 RepID=UPI0008E78C38|nr:cytochrome o ubiquinol oxidase subunit IV [Paenibacillus sp. UNC496MF]SFI41728.1 cytochrome o ubiquinol oxidase operon protein cyoD [Paenibacillus sp. UNC496MF]